MYIKQFCHIHSLTHTYLFEFHRIGAVHRGRCYGDPEDSWGEKEKRDFLNSWGILSEGDGDRIDVFLQC